MFLLSEGRRQNTANQGGFTLVELAVVLVIIGLIIGGVLTGSALIRAAELQSVMRDMSNFSAAVTTFQLKYNAIPGDMANATNIWGSASGGCPFGAGTGTQTCDGDGNGFISAPPDDPANVMQHEEYHAWQHLSDAGYIQGHYTGLTAGTGWTAKPGVNVPASRLGGGGYSLLYMGVQQYATPDRAVFNGSYGHTIIYGTAADGYQLLNPVISTQDAQSLDNKMDDGKPGTGKVLSMASSSTFAPNCASAASNSPETAAYRMDQGGPVCTMLFKMGF
jgi:prepilin-type N-terminal cleavage/methylation domain-containing protein